MSEQTHCRHRPEDCPGDDETKNFLESIRDLREPERLHNRFSEYFHYDSMELKTGTLSMEEFQKFEDKYLLQNNSYRHRLSEISSLSGWLKQCAREIDSLIRGNEIVEDLCRRKRDFLFWALSVQLELANQIPLAKEVLEFYLRRFLESFMGVRQIKHLALLKKPRTINGKQFISVVTPFYNGEKTIGETLDSLAKQTYQNFEVIIVNDGSTPASTAALDEIIRQNQGMRVRVKNSGHVGQAPATNIGIADAKGSFILPLDADDQIAVDYMEKTLSEFEKDPSLDVAYSQTVSYGFMNRLGVRREFSVPGIFMSNHLNICSLIKKESILRFSGYDENIAGYEDWNLWIFFAKHGMKFKRIPEVMFFYRKFLASRGFRSKDKDFLKRRMIMESHPDIYRLPTKEQEPLLYQNSKYIPPFFLTKETRERYLSGGII
ncbi:MAG: glycosyltransferase family 2 protein [bacterium]|nr:glycosyltransferase family 2 protein [bacterium]